jgi:hypothetical protein
MMNFKRLDVSACAYEWCCVLIALILFFSYLGFTLSRPFHAGFFWMDYMQDDFFYYLKVAQNIASGHGSTFNNIVRTNGYHPLYEGVLVVVSKLTDSPSGVLCFLAMSTFVSSTAILAACTALFRRFQIPLVSAFALALLCTLYALRTLFSGMEVIITIPLILILLLILLRPEWWTRNIWTGLATGLLAALVALSRLDTLILLTLLAVAMLASQSVRSRLVLSSLLGVLIGLLPVAAYFLFNHSEFGTWMPVSGMA